MAKRSIRSTKEIEAENIPVYTEQGTFGDVSDVDLEPVVDSDYIDGGESPDNFNDASSPAGAKPWNGLDVTDTKYAKEEEVIDENGADTIVVIHVDNGVYRTKSGSAIRSSRPLQIKSSKTSVLVPVSSNKLVKARVMGSLSKKMSLFVRSGRHAYNGRGQCIMNVKENFILADSASTFVRSSTNKETIKSLLSKYVQLTRPSARRTSVRAGVRRQPNINRPVITNSSRLSRVRRVRSVSSGNTARRSTRFGIRNVSNSSRQLRPNHPVVINSSRMERASRSRSVSSGEIVRRPSTFNSARGSVRHSRVNRPIVIRSSKRPRRSYSVRSNRNPVRLSVGCFERPQKFSPARQAVASARTQQVLNQENFQSYVESKKIVAPKQVNSKRQQQFEQNVSLLTSRMI